MTPASSSILRNLPIEVIVRIVDFLAENPRDVVNVSHADSWLRSITISFPTTWTTILVTDRSSSLELAQLAAARSKCCKLDLTVHLVEDEPSLSDAEIRVLLSAVEGRVRTLKAHLLRHGPEDSLIPSIIRRSVVPNLEVLDLRYMPCSNHFFRRNFAFASMPRLTHLTVAGIIPILRCDVPHLRFLAIKEAQELDWSMTDFTTFLSHVTEIEELHVEELRFSEYFNTAMPLPKLRRLTLIVECRVLYSLLDKINAPNLEEVHVGGPENSTFVPSQSLSIRTFDSVHTVKIGSRWTLDTSRFAVATIQYSFPSVRVLEVTDTEVLYDFFKVPGDGGMNWRLLAGIKITQAVPTEFACGAILDAVCGFLERRAAGIKSTCEPPLLTLEVEVGDYTEGSLDRVAQYVDFVKVGGEVVRSSGRQLEASDSETEEDADDAVQAGSPKVF